MKQLSVVIAGLLLAGGVWAENGSYVNVRDFGAKGDGVCDDTAALQRAADKLGDAHSSFGREANCLINTKRKYVDGPFPAMVFPAGTYRVTGPIVITGNVKLCSEEGAKILNDTTDKETFYVRNNHHMVVEGLTFDGGAVHIRQWTMNHDVSYLKVSNCKFFRASDTAIISVDYKWFKGDKTKRQASEENVEAVRGENGLYQLISRGPLSDFTPYNNSTLIIVENSKFIENATAFWGFTDGITMRRCDFVAAKGATTPQLRLGNGGCLGVEIYLHDLRIFYPAPAVAGRAAILFEGGRVELVDSKIVSDDDLVAVRSLSRVNEYTTASSFTMRNVTVNTGAAPVMSLPGPSFPNRLYASNVKTTQSDIKGKKLYAFEVEPDEEFVKGIPHRDPADDYKHLTEVPTENCCTIVRENIDESVFDVSLPKAIQFLEVPGPGKFRRDYTERDGVDFARILVKGQTYADETIGRAFRHVPGNDDTDKIAALIRKARQAGGGTVELPSRWITITRPIELPNGVLLTAKGCAAIESIDREGPMFIIPEGANVAIKGVHFTGGGTAIATTATLGRLTLVDCGFTDFKGPAIRAESVLPRGFRVEMTGGNSYTAQLYRGNAEAVIDGYWLECATAMPSAAETPRSFATMINLMGGKLTLRDFLGVPVYFGHLTKAEMSSENFTNNWLGDYRWIDNRGELYCKNVRFGGEFRGITAIYAYGKSITYVEGGVNETSNEVMRPGRNCIVACDSEDCEVAVIDALAHTYRTAQLVKVLKDGKYVRHPKAIYSNNFPFRLTNDLGEK